MRDTRRAVGLGLWLAAGLLGACDASSPGDAATLPTSGETGSDSGATATTGELASDCDAPIGEGACALETICEVYTCGGKDSLYNHDGCPRTQCTLDAECDDGWRCFALVLEAACVTGELACEVGADACECSPVTACAGNGRGHCLPDSVYPPEQDCQPLLMGCSDELAAWHTAIVATRDDHQAGGRNELAAQLTACAPLALQAVVDCGTPVCEAICAAAPCSHPDADSCVAACEASIEGVGASELAAWIAAVGAQPRAACDCSACEGLASNLCAGTWGCGG